MKGVLIAKSCIHYLNFKTSPLKCLIITHSYKICFNTTFLTKNICQEVLETALSGWLHYSLNPVSKQAVLKEVLHKMNTIILFWLSLCLFCFLFFVHWIKMWCFDQRGCASSQSEENNSYSHPETHFSFQNAILFQTQISKPLCRFSDHI